MLYLKELDFTDIEKAYEYISSVPADENGFLNDLHGVPRVGFEAHILRLMHHAKGLDLPEGFVPETHYLLWQDGTPVGWFRLRHRLCPSLVNGAGHIGYSIREGFRGHGFGTAGLALLLEKAAEIVSETEIYLRANRDNPASLRVMLKNGGVLHHEDAEKVYVRIQNPGKGDEK